MKKIFIFSLVLLSLLVLCFLFLNKKPSLQSHVQAQGSLRQLISNTTCPAGFIYVPGNSLYTTQGFCVMKYDAKCASTGNPNVGLQPAAGSTCVGDGVYNNSAIGCACRGNLTISSTKSGFPIAFIPENNGTQDDAVLYCQAKGWHVITNNEWMTIARNVEQVKDNWCNPNGTGCGFTPGTAGKILANGYNDFHNELSASTTTHGGLIAGDDTQPCFGTTTDGSNTCGGTHSQKRTLTLSNGEVIWDFAGNVWQWVDFTLMRQDEPKSASYGKLDTGWKTSDFASGSHASVLIDNGKGPLAYDVFRPSNPSWNANNGVGRVYHYSSANDTSTDIYGVIRGGNWRHGYDDGAFTFHLSPPPSRMADDVGFRCAFSP